MTNDQFEKIIDGLDYGSMSIKEVYNECIGVDINYKQAECFLYSLKMKRDKRFELFIALYEASLKNNPQVAFSTFREAYCASDNIYLQIKSSQYSFDIKDFISSMQKQNINFIEFMSEDEKSYYDSLPEVFTSKRLISGIPPL